MTGRHPPSGKSVSKRDSPNLQRTSKKFGYALFWPILFWPILSGQCGGVECGVCVGVVCGWVVGYWWWVVGGCVPAPLPDSPPPDPLPGTPPPDPRRLWGRRGLTRQPENSKRAHLRVPALQTPPKFHEKTPRETKKNTKETPRESKKERKWCGNGEKRAKFWASHLRAPTAPCGPHPSGPYFL